MILCNASGRLKARRKVVHQVSCCFFNFCCFGTGRETLSANWSNGSFRKGSFMVSVRFMGVGVGYIIGFCRTFLELIRHVKVR
ncbi:hypothetical protein KC19_10G153000 [Ceratodon purpureus]|uniref:Uncharacterized protein n=1 Tax=Ceratodon purpureus TaxID=3225 RepID=A0A8T0GNB2_CERPU|nr:hypothetical protein KC19_10G153000 [Ceratodon purpureus]